MKYYNKPFKAFDNDALHVAFEVEDKIISFEANPCVEDYFSMVIWESKEEYLENMCADEQPLEKQKMKFYDLQTKEYSAHDTIEGLFSMLCEGYCECGEGYDVLDKKDDKMKCLNCWRLNNLEQVSEDDMRSYIEENEYIIEQEVNEMKQYVGMEVIKLLADLQDAIVAELGSQELDSLITFDHNGTEIYYPFADETLVLKVDPIEYYGDSFLNSKWSKYL